MSTINATNIKNAASSVTNIILDTNGGITSAGATFTGDVTSQGFVTTGNYDSSDANGKGARLSDNGTLFAQRPEPNGIVFAALNGYIESLVFLVPSRILKDQSDNSKELGLQFVGMIGQVGAFIGTLMTAELVTESNTFHQC